MNEKRLRVMAECPGNLKLGDYVFASRWGDADWNDPWAIGYVSCIGANFIEVGDEDGSSIPGVGSRGFKHFLRVTPKQADSIMREYKRRERTAFIPEVLAEIVPDAAGDAEEE